MMMPKGLLLLPGYYCYYYYHYYIFIITSIMKAFPECGTVFNGEQSCGVPKETEIGNLSLLNFSKPKR